MRLEAIGAGIARFLGADRRQGSLADRAGAESEQVGDQFPDLLERDGPDVRVRRLDYAVDADGRRQVRLGHTESGYFNLAQPCSPRSRAGHDHDRVLPELEHIIGGDDDGRTDEPRLAPRRRPKIARTTSPARIGHITHRRIEHGLGVSIERGAGELSADDATTLPVV